MLTIEKLDSLTPPIIEFLSDVLGGLILLKRLTEELASFGELIAARVTR